MLLQDELLVENGNELLIKMEQSKSDRIEWSRRKQKEE